jgi:hypothetical protein
MDHVWDPSTVVQFGNVFGPWILQECVFSKQNCIKYPLFVTVL